MNELAPPCPMLIPDVSDQEAYLAEKMSICQRFATEIVLPIAEVFKVSDNAQTMLGDQVLNRSSPRLL